MLKTFNQMMTKKMNQKSMALNRKGYVMVAFMFLIGVAVPGFISLTYFNLMNQSKNIQSQIQNTQVRLGAESALAAAQFELQNVIDVKTLDNESIFNTEDSVLSNGVAYCLSGEGTPLSGYTCARQNWFNSGFKEKLDTFSTELGASANVTQTVHDLEFVSEEFVDLISIEQTSGVARFKINAKVGLKHGEKEGQVWGVSETFLVKTSNLADYSIFTYRDFVTSPGTDTVYEGPIYVGRNAYVTPNKNKTVTLTFDPTNFDTERPTPFIMKVRGQFHWMGPRTLGPDPYDPNTFASGIPKRYLYDPEEQPANYEHDVFGMPVFYYFASNNNPGWIVNYNSSNQIYSDGGISTIRVRSSLNQEVYTELVGASHPAPAVSYNYDNVFTSRRSNTDVRPDLYFSMIGGIPAVPQPNRYIATTLHTTPAALANDSSAVTPSTSVSTNLTADPFSTPKDPAWDGFIEDNFEQTVSGQPFNIFEDNAEEQSLRLGGAEDPEILIQLAENDDPASYKNVKVEWIAQAGSADTSLSYSGIVIDLRHYRCEHPWFAAACSDTFSTWPNEILPEDFETLGIINRYANVNEEEADLLVKTYYDERSARDFFIVTLDIARLVQAIQNQEINVPQNKPLVLYFGFPEEGVFYDDKLILSGYLDSVLRIVNGDSLPEHGLTIATNGFVQIVGNYNVAAPSTDTACKTAILDQNPTIDQATILKPAAIFADQIMVLSESWQDDPTAPNYMNPSDNLTYPSTYLNDTSYLAHPVRCYPDCENVKINAMLIGGDVPNQLTPYAEAFPSTSPGLGYGEWFYGFYLSNFRPNVQDTYTIKSGVSNWGTYLNQHVVKNQNLIYNYNDPQYKWYGGGFQPNPNTQPSNYHDPTDDDDLTQEEYEAIPVYLASYDANGVAHVNPSGTYIGTVGELFNSVANGGSCDTCNGDIPLYLKVDQNGNVITSNMEDNHIKPEVSGNLLGTLRTGMRLRPGERVAVLQRWDTASETTGTKALLAKEFSRRTSSCGSPQVWIYPSTGNNNPPTSCNQGDSRQINCQLTLCSTCTDFNQICGTAGGEGCAQTVPDVQTCQTEYCTRLCLDPIGQELEWIPQNDLLGTGPQAFYVIGGSDRLANPVPRWSYLPFWLPRYNGGFENFIRYGENWGKWDCGSPSNNTFSSCAQTGETNKVTFTGAIDILWTSKTLVDYSGKPAYWTPSTYIAPEREFKYARQFRLEECVPPGIPNAIQFSSENYQQN